jgi:molybdopterin molybdotransferase
MDMPPFDKATVDGYACPRESLNDDLEVLEIIAAGSAPEKKIGPGQCSKIMTGAPVPEGADMVFMVEDSTLLPGGKVRFTGSSSKDNISPRGEDIRTGNILAARGRLIKPQDIAMMALSGTTSVEVSKLPVVTVISSGNELVEPEDRPGNFSIRNSNAYQLMAQIERSGATGRYLGIARDDEASTLHLVNKALDISDIVLITGGVSMGDFDLVPGVLEQAGVKILFSRIKIQPGRPTTFGVHRKALVFGLPGNPVSSFVQFELLVRPLICRMTGSEFVPEIKTFIMKESYFRRTSERMGLIPVYITEDGMAAPVPYHGSAHISAFSKATGLITMPEGILAVEKGEKVNVRQI